jgi:hypothetical protein
LRRRKSIKSYAGLLQDNVIKTIHFLS